MSEIVLRDNSGVHSREDKQAVREGFKMICDVIGKSGIAGKWAVRPTVRVRWSASDKDRLSVRNYDTSKRIIRVRCRPGNNGTAWEYDMYAPPGQRLDDFLKNYERLCDESIRSNPEKETEKVFPAPAPIQNANGQQASQIPPQRAAPAPLAAVVASAKQAEQQLPAYPQASLSDMTNMMAQMGIITQRIAERDRQRKELTARKDLYEAKVIEMMADIETTTACIKQLDDEEAADTQAAAARQMVAMMAAIGGK